MKKKLSVLLLAGLVLMSSCGGKGETEYVPEVVSEEESDMIATTVVGRMDVVAEERFKCKFTALETVDLSFGMDDGLIQDITVKKGDYVEKGDLLATVDLKDAGDKIASLEFKVKELNLNLKQAKENKDFELEEARILYEGYTKKKSDDTKAYEKKIKSITENYDISIKTIEDEIFIANERLNKAREDYNKGTIYAPISGQITYVMNGAAQSYSKTGQTIFTISDTSKSYFVTDVIENRDIVLDSVEYPIQYHVMSTSYDATVTRVNPVEDDGKLYFAVTGEFDIPVDSDGVVTVETARRENVLAVKTSAVHESDRGPFVYLVKDGTLSMKYVEVGVKNDQVTEITGGLQEGDLVAIKK
jgi:RND family efflux transporter MFP subunit